MIELVGVRVSEQADSVLAAPSAEVARIATTRKKVNKLERDILQAQVGNCRI